MKRLGLSVLAIVATCVPLLASCAAPTPVPTPSPQPVQAVATEMPKLRDPVRLILWHTEPEGTPAAELLADLASRFRRECPWITVEPVYAGSYEDIYKKGMAAIRAGHPPDLAVAYESRIAEFMNAGAIVRLQPYADDPEIGLTDADRADIFPGVWEAGRYPEFDDQMLSLPYAKGALALYYNLTALQAAGIEAPPKSWDEFEAACLAASQGDVVGYACVESATVFDGWLYSRGASQLGDGQARAVFNGPEGVEALALLKRLLDAGAAVRPEGDHADRAMFAAGKAVFAMDSTATLPAYALAITEAGQGFEWGCTIIPQADAGKARTVLYGPSFCVFKTGEPRQQAAWRFIRWFTDTAQSAECASNAGYAPVRRSAVELLAGSGWLDEHKVATQAFQVVLPGAFPEPNARGEQEIRKIIEDAWLAATSGVKAPQEALDEAAGRANEALAARQ